MDTPSDYEQYTSFNSLLTYNRQTIDKLVEDVITRSFLLTFVVREGHKS
jgi:hypothetical protein